MMKACRVVMVLLAWGCSEGQSTQNTTRLPPSYLECTDSACLGRYSGPEFVNGSDVAHQFSNKMAKSVGDKLKELYIAKQYSAVDLELIKMTTQGMDGKGDVTYSLVIPFVKVADSCQAFTAFDHRGGWGHTPKIATIIDHFSNAKGLEYQFAETPEGLTEYWLQWKLTRYQAGCD
jgi:hypothetical protein